MISVHVEYTLKVQRKRRKTIKKSNSKRMNDNACLMVMWYKKKSYQAGLQNKEKLKSLCNQNEKIKFA